jgi:hypothetical protein
MPLNIQDALNQSMDQQAKIDQFNPPAQPKPSGDPNYLKIARIAGIAGSGMDWLSTYNTLKRGNHEDNPTLQWTHDNPLGTALAGAGEDALTALLLERVLKNHPKVLSTIYGARSGMGAYLAHQNFSLPDAKK